MHERRTRGIFDGRQKDNLKQRGVKVMTGASVNRIESGESSCRVEIKTPSGQRTIETEWVLSAVGRSPNVEHLDLEEEIETTIHPHPTMGEAIYEAALAGNGMALHLPDS